MKRALITLLICVVFLYLGIVLLLSWQEYKYIMLDNNFAEALQMIFYGGWFILGTTFLFVWLFIIISRHR